MRPFFASGTIRVMRFVKIDVAADFRVQECDANEFGIGISQPGARAHPVLDTTDPPNAAVDGDPVEVIRDEGYVVLAGTVASGDFLKSDADGKAVAVTVGGVTAGVIDEEQNIVAQAFESGISGQHVWVQIVRFSTCSNT